MSKQSRTRGLIPFKKGQSGNPGGRPKGSSLTAVLRAELDAPCVEGSPVTHRQMVVGRLLSLAEAGDITAIREVFDRAEGKSIARTESGDPGAFAELADKSVDELRQMLKAVE